MTGELELQLKHIPAQWVLSTRENIKDWAEIEEKLRDFASELGEIVEGAPICRLLSQIDDGYLAEFSFPVREGTTHQSFGAGQLEDDHVIAVTHYGALSKSDDAPGITATAQQAFRQATEQKRLIGDNPTRYVFLERPAVRESGNSKAVTEIQISYHLPVWLSRLEDGLKRSVSEAEFTQIVADSGTIATSNDPGEIRAWVMSAVNRIEKVIPDAQTRACILQNCAHHYPRVQLERMRAVYDEMGDLRAFIERLNEDDELFPTRIWMDEDGAPIAYIQRSVPPWNREAYAATDDPVEKRFHACFCVMVRDAIRTGEPISPDFCNCSGGWFVQMWEAILDRRLRIDVVESVLQGHDRCLFAIHLPEELLA